MTCPILAVEAVYEDVRDRFALEAPDVQVVFGWRSPANQLTQGANRANRIAFVPGDDTKAGDYLDARYPGKLSRSLRTMLETCTIFCWAFDGTSPDTAYSDLAQWRAARLLLDAAVRAVDLSLRARGGLHDQKPFSGAEWILQDTEPRAFGAEVKFVLTLMSTVPDELPDLSGPDRVETLTAAPSVTVEIADTEDFDFAGEEDPPPLTPADDPEDP